MPARSKPNESKPQSSRGIRKRPNVRSVSLPPLSEERPSGSSNNPVNNGNGEQNQPRRFYRYSLNVINRGFYTNAAHRRTFVTSLNSINVEASEGPLNANQANIIHAMPKEQRIGRNQAINLPVKILFKNDVKMQGQGSPLPIVASNSAIPNLQLAISQMATVGNNANMLTQSSAHVNSQAQASAVTSGGSSSGLANVNLILPQGNMPIQLSGNGNSQANVNRGTSSGIPNARLVFPQGNISIQLPSNVNSQANANGGTPGIPNVRLMLPQGNMGTQLSGNANSQANANRGIPNVRLVFPQGNMPTQLSGNDNSQANAFVRTPSGIPNVHLVFPQGNMPTQLSGNDNSQANAFVRTPSGIPKVRLMFPQGIKPIESSQNANPSTQAYKLASAPAKLQVSFPNMMADGNENIQPDLVEPMVVGNKRENTESNGRNGQRLDAAFGLMSLQQPVFFENKPQASADAADQAQASVEKPSPLRENNKN